MSLTVSELLALEGLSALRLRAGKQGLQRAVRWYYVAENEHIAEWIMGGELVFITGINHPRDEANLIQLLMEGKQRGIAGMVILTGEAYIHAIPATLIALADELGMPLIEQPYLLKMVIVTERIGTALVRSENVLQSQRDILMQLVTGDYPDLQMLHQRALHQQLDFTRPLRLAALRLEGLSRLFRQYPPEQAEAWLLGERGRAAFWEKMSWPVDSSVAATCLSWGKAPLTLESLLEPETTTGLPREDQARRFGTLPAASGGQGKSGLAGRLPE